MCSGDDGDKSLGRYYHERAQHAAHDHVVFHMSSGADRHLQRSAPLRLDEDRAAATNSTTSRCSSGLVPSRSATNSTRQCWRAPARARRRASRRRCRTSASWPGSATSMSAKRCYRARLSPKRIAATIADRDRRAERACRTSGRRHQGGAQRGDQGRRLDRCATTSSPTASSACSSIISASTIARARNAARPAAAAWSSASCRMDARRFIVRCARSDRTGGKAEAGHELRDHYRRDPRPRRADPAQPAAGAQRAQQRADPRIEPSASTLSRPMATSAAC